MQNHVIYLLVSFGEHKWSGGKPTSFAASNLVRTEQTAGERLRTVICAGKSDKKTAAGRQMKKISSNSRVKSKARQEGLTLGPKTLSLLSEHSDAIARN
jgi:ribosome biogenesis protein Tsr3